ncbi:MAG: VanZ family protein [Eubacterium sp.]|nr:VanZ family protein [Eubacterium sp.]
MQTKEKKTFAYIVFGIYLVFLCWLILFKLADSIDKIPSMRGINLIPFHYDQLSNTKFHQMEVIYNVLVFVPAGFFFTAFGKRKIIVGFAACAMLSICFEILQWIFALGASDITDLISNTIGGAFGTMLYFVLGKLCKGHQLKIACILGAILEVFFIILIIALSILNK